MHSNNATLAIKFTVVVHVTLDCINTENIPLCMQLFPELQSVDEKEFNEKKKKKPPLHSSSFPLLSYYCTYNKTVAWFCHSTIHF